MDFFEAQELRHKRTKWLVLLYVLSILFIILGIFGTLALILRLSLLAPESVPAENNMQYLLLFAVVAAVNVLIIGAGTLYKTSELQSGGQKIASLMGGTRIPSDTKDLGERRLLNVVEEMALASGVSVPPVYIMNDEPSINAFAAGFSPTDAVIGVNKGTIEQLNRDELQGVIAHGIQSYSQWRHATQHPTHWSIIWHPSARHDRVFHNSCNWIWLAPQQA